MNEYSELEQRKIELQHELAEVEKRLQDWKLNINPGMRLMYEDGEEYIVARVGGSAFSENVYCLVNLKTGNVWSEKTSRYNLRTKRFEDLRMFEAQVDDFYPVGSKRAGIFLVRNTNNDKVLLGYSYDIENAWADNIELLDSGAHWNRHFQHSWNLYGEDCFEYDVIGYCQPEQLMEIFEARKNAWERNHVLYNY